MTLAPGIQNGELTMTEFIKSACPHDCPSACALEVERLSPTRIGKVRGARDFDYTDGAICAKVARYAERIHHPERLCEPLRRTGAKGDGPFQPISWDDALDEIAQAFLSATQRHGSESVWPYHSGGTMGIVQRYGLERLRNVMQYSGELTTICVGPSDPGWRAGVGALEGTDPREIADSDLIIVWGGNPVSTQVNLMRHIQRARKERGAKLVVVDCFRTPTVDKADIPIILRPGTDGALACAMISVMLEEGLADLEYLRSHSDFDDDMAAHFCTRTAAWAAAITGISEEQIRALARLYGSTPRAYIRLGFGFTRSRNGAVNMHAVTALPAVSGAWRHRGGGAFFLNVDNWKLDTTVAHGLDVKNPAVRVLDQSRIGAILCGDTQALQGGPPVTAMFMQNANSAVVAPDSRAVRKGLTRDDLFLCVHEQFMTATAQCADIVLPATMSFEHDDIYYGLGHTAITYGPKVIEAHAQCRSNHDVTAAIARRLGGAHRGFELSARELIDLTLRDSGLGGIDAIEGDGFSERPGEFGQGDYTGPFPNDSGRFRFRPDWNSLGPFADGMPAVPDHWTSIEQASEAHPLRLITPPARMFLNSSFTQSPSSRAHEKEPAVVVHPQDALRFGVVDGAVVRIGNERGELLIKAKCEASALPGTVIVEGVWPNSDFAGGLGINQLVGADPVAPRGGVAFHDTAVWLRTA
ncbi:MAG: anaerobic selenocysteine-containing dehydrogenase [Gammaproteobacteria bacterium]|jgi:anaerobic selenocysteine-containing dehydrogenase